MAKQLIDALGGIQPVAKALDTTTGAVANWRLRNSIPWAYRHDVARLAATLGVQLPDDFWQRAKKAA